MSKLIDKIAKELASLSPETKSWLSTKFAGHHMSGIFEKMSDTERIYLQYEEHREYLKINEAYEELKKELISQGLNPQDYLNDDPESFNRAYNQWKGRRNKEK